MFSKRKKKSQIIIPQVIDTGPEPNLQKKPKHSEPESVLFTYTDDKGLKTYSDGGAILDNIDPESSTINDALKQKEISNKIKTGELDSSVYRGQKGYALYAEKSDASIYASKYTGSLGPVKAPSHVRTTCRFDYAYGLCKDWRIGGYCGYGDSCIFVHDRSEFKTGWELEKEWEKEQEEKRKKAIERMENIEKLEKIEQGQEEETEEEEEKKSCGICKGVVEVVTQCKHEFCYKCCIEQYAKTPKCYVCGKDTKGIFNDISK